MTRTPWFDESTDLPLLDALTASFRGKNPFTELSPPG